MVNTVLTDKTGTLTRNVMEFFKASIGGVSYGTGVTEIERANAARRGIQIETHHTGHRRARGAVDVAGICWRQDHGSEVCGDRAHR